MHTLQSYTVQKMNKIKKKMNKMTFARKFTEDHLNTMK